jgi:hypothetical protein
MMDMKRGIYIFCLWVILLAAGCVPVAKPSFPVELFQKRLPTIDDQGCSISLSSVRVILPDQENNPPILYIQGNISTECSDLQFGVEPPDSNHDILVNLQAIPPKGVTPSANVKLKTFDITYKIEKARVGSYTVYINGTYGTEFTMP